MECIPHGWPVRRTWLLVVAAAAIASIFLFHLAPSPHELPTSLVRWPRLPATWRARQDGPPASIQPILNETLGFQSVMAINLPERTDKRDSLALAASLTNISVTFVDGVKGTDVANKSLPEGITLPPWVDGQVGCWRSHVNAIRRIVDERQSSALILEDDADWDVRLKTQMLDFARGTRYLLNQSVEAATQSPYGDGWDVLWLGHCGDARSEWDNRTYAIYNDPSVFLVEGLNMGGVEALQGYPPQTRLVHRADNPLCLFGYALSLRGAQRLLYALSVNGVSGPVDNALSGFCKHERRATCINSHPSYIQSYRMKGRRGRNSDINDEISDFTEAQTLGLQWSARLNSEALLYGTPFRDDSPRRLPGMDG